ncbi:MAG: hypothetical protein IKR57_06200 [Bacilli bacterium]|nr:hypothetical protein [Bacilli bacterium]
MNNKFSSNKYYANKVLAEEEVGKLESHNQQKSLERFSKRDYNQNKALESMNINQSLAKSIYEFLIAKSDKLPSFEFFGKVFANSKTGIMSMGYGVTVSNDYEVIHSSPSEDSDVERIDIINLDGYIAFYEKPGFKEENYNYDEKEYNKTIDVNKSPLFEIGRVNYLRDYLKKCQEYIHSFNKGKQL